MIHNYAIIFSNNKWSYTGLSLIAYQWNLTKSIWKRRLSDWFAFVLAIWQIQTNVKFLISLRKIDQVLRFKLKWFDKFQLFAVLMIWQNRTINKMKLCNFSPLWIINHEWCINIERFGCERLSLKVGNWQKRTDKL